VAQYIGALDQGTTSTRFIVFDRDGRIVAGAQREHEQITPRAGRVEHDPKEILARTREVIDAVDADDLAAIGVTNQRETTVVWDRETGAVTGSLIQWLRDRLGIIDSAPEVEQLARTVDDNGGVYFVPAFSGLFAPYWRTDARGVIVGLTAYANRGHIARAALEATAWQTREVVDAANAVAGVPFRELRVDGGMTANDLLMQFQADVLGVPVIRPQVAETTALGAAFAAGLAVGFWADQDELRERWAEDKRWEPAMDEGRREREYARWKQAVERSLGWLDG
jgi:glycerol kinase